MNSNLKTLFLILLLLLVACPKKNVKSIEEIEKQEQLRELINDDEDMWDDLPEAESKDTG
tara:strand:+ start:3510 stop:3689 length:180 start_codon:yes stop_codon:yes gene_type:complete